MKKYLLFIFILSLITFSSSAQVFWSEDFGTGCNTGNFADGFTTANGVWTVTDVAPPANYANDWFISGHTRNTGIGNCGADCSGGNNQTLHIGNVAIPSLSLNAEDGSYLTGLFCSVSFCSTTHKRVETPVIDCSGKSNVSISFIYFEGGDVPGGTNGDFSLWYYDGSSWTMLDPMAKTNNASCNGTIYGVWTSFTISLPASANNNGNVKIGFQWDNDDSSAGTDPSAAVDDIQLSVPLSAPPVAGFSADVTTGCDSICVTFTDTSNGATARSWSFPGGTPSTSTSATQLVCYNSPGNYDVTLVSSNSFGSDTATQTGYISVAQTPIPDFTVSDQSLCVGDCVVYGDLSSGAIQNYSWNFDGAFPSTSNQQNPAFICYQTAGSFSVTLTVQNGTCINSITRVAFINVNQPTTPVVTLAGDTLISTPYSAYQWFEVTSGPIASAIFQNYIVTATGDYYVCIQDAFGCTACSDTIHFDLSGIHELNAPTVSIYPNPVEDLLMIKSDLTISEISIVDVCGKTILSAEPKTNSAIKSIDTSLLTSGVYWIEVNTPYNKFREMLVKSGSK